MRTAVRRIGGRASSRTMAAESQTSSGTILVVEDDPSVREMLALLLEGEGYRTIAVEDGRGGAGIGGAPARYARTSSSPTTICRTA